MVSFAELGVRPAFVEELARAGITEPFAVQALTLPDGLAGRDVCAKAKTGSGKTIAFALPLVQRLTPSGDSHPRGLVLVPTRELAVQVVGVLSPLGKKAGLVVRALYGGTPLDKDITACARGIDIVVATPGRLIDLIERGAIVVDRVEMAVLDEADRMADMGFLPQVEWILRRTRDAAPQMMLFSATLDGQIDGIVRRYLRDPVLHEVEEDAPTIDTMTHRFLAVHEMDRVKVVAAIAQSSFRTLVFTRTKRGADRLTAQLQREGVDAGAIHGDLRQNARERTLGDFSAGRLPVLVATDVAARGIHIDEVDVVVQFDLPEDQKAYLHRAGRTARAGQTGTVATFVLWNQVLDVERLQRRLGLAEPIVEVFSNDPRLSDLVAFGALTDVAS